MDVLGPWTGRSGSVRAIDVVAEIAAVVKRRTRPLAFLFDDIDRDARLAPRETELLNELGRAASCPVVFTSRRESGTSWRRMGGRNVLPLTPFTISDLRNCVERSTELRNEPMANLNPLLQMATRPKESGRIEPVVAYDLLRALQQ